MITTLILVYGFYINPTNILFLQQRKNNCLIFFSNSNGVVVSDKDCTDVVVEINKQINEKAKR